MFNLARKPRGRVVAVADVGGGSAGVAIVEARPGNPPNVVTFERLTLPMEARSRDASAAGVIAQLGAAAEKALTAYAAALGKDQTPHVESAYAIIRAPWTRSKTMRAESVLSEGTRIESATIATLAQEAVKGDTEFDHGNVFEASVVRVELNGYPTGKPEGKYANRIAVSVLLSDCNPEIRTSVGETLQKTFACPPPVIRSGVRAIISVLNEHAVLLKDCLIVNVTSNATSFIVVRKGVAAEIEHITEGTWSIVKRIAGEKMPEEVLTLIRLLSEDKCENDACESIRASIAHVELDLVKIFGEVFVKMSTLRRLPNALILFVPNDLSDWLSRFFARIDFAPFTVTTRPFSVEFSAREEFAKIVAGFSAASSDPALALASALVPLEMAGSWNRQPSGRPIV